MPDHIITYLASKPGINRDTTAFDSVNYTDGKWVRFTQGKPAKIGGYELVVPGDTEIIRTLVVSPFDLSALDARNPILNALAAENAIIYLGRASTFKTTTISTSGQANPEIDITPADYTPDVNNVWCVDFLTTYDTDLNPINNILVLSTPNGNNISGNVNGILYQGVVNDNIPLTPVPTGNMSPDTEFVEASGDIIAVPPYAVVIGNQGTIRWSEVNNLESWPTANKASITNTKLIVGYNVIGSFTPTFICWSLNSVIKCAFDSTTMKFIPTIITNSITVLSANSVVNALNQFFWPGTDQWWFYNGIVQPLKNIMNKDYFYERLNLNQRTRVFGIHLPRWNEIWWFYPAGDSKENNAIIIYNYQVEIWYDDDSIGRAAGAPPDIFKFPLLTDSTTLPDLSQVPPPGEQPQQVYGLWFHEIGTDKVYYGFKDAIESYAVSHYHTFFDNSPDNDFQIKTLKFEPDVFQQTGNMTLQLLYKGYANGTLKLSPIYSWNSTTPFLSLDIQGRQMAFKIGSNEAGGSYQLGKCIIQNTLGDERQGNN